MISFRATNKLFHFHLLLVTGVILASCGSKEEMMDIEDMVLDARTFPEVYATRAIKLADTDGNGTINLVEWTSAGGDEKSFLVVDTDSDGHVTRAELVRVGSDARFLAHAVKIADQNADGKLTKSEYNEAEGEKVFRYEF